WALRRSGMERREVGASMTTFMVLLYAVFFGSVLLDGILLRSGALPGPAPVGLTIVPAVIAGSVILLAASASLIPRDLDRRWGDAPGWFPQGLLVRIGAVAATVGAGVAGAIREVRCGRPGVLGAVMWWAFDVATLWACFHAFGDAPPIGVIVMGYFVGQVGNTLPLPGGVGGVEGGMIGAFVAFGVSGHLALVSVLAYRAFAFWLPTVPGGIAYLRLTRIVRGWDDPNNVSNGDAAPLIADDAAPGGPAPSVRRGG
ncbi:MAG: putative heme transporter, partial [Solirubrobacteraceae bacterium]|nr:putative heme transporter [Solirubrobacteraceae bacterium]